MAHQDEPQSFALPTHLSPSKTCGTSCHPLVSRRGELMVQSQGQAEPSSLNFYIQYEYLSSREFGMLLTACSGLSESIYRYYAESLRGTWAQSPMLELSEVRTGESIKFKFVERAIPSISS